MKSVMELFFCYFQYFYKIICTSCKRFVSACFFSLYFAEPCPDATNVKKSYMYNTNWNDFNNESSTIEIGLLIFYSAIPIVSYNTN